MTMINQLKTTLAAGTLAAAAVFAPLSAHAEMHSVTRSEIAHLNPVEGSIYAELYQHPDLANFPFNSIYIEDATNEMPTGEIYSRRWRPEYVDDLAALFTQNLRDAMEPTGMLVDEPGEQTLVISPRLMFVEEYDERTTGTNIREVAPQYRERGHAVMEMIWRAGPGGEIVTAVRDGRGHQNHDPVTDRDDRFTDAKDVFVIWANDLAGFFGSQPDEATN